MSAGLGGNLKEPGSGVGQSVMRELPEGTRTSVLNPQGDITLMEISLLIFHEKRQPLN